jgi:hypothetical protein
MSKKAFEKIAAGLNEAVEIARRRFGSDHDKTCKRPEVRTCALWECQIANECQAHSGRGS